MIRYQGGGSINKISLFFLLSVVLLFIFYILYLFNYIPHTKYNDNDFNITTYISSKDEDCDGVDDQTDILNSVKEYVSTNPRYKSKYYGTGYPNDCFGVCTDVVAFGLKNAGYDLMELVHQHIQNHQEKYDIDVIDKNIDFRRVQNLKIFFKDNAQSLTTDIHQIEEWQGGDIVIFQNHIGIVSDHRNKHGVSFVIHHANPYQLFYEEDILEYRNDIIGHYRIS